MSQPTPYTRSYSFTDFSSGSPASQPPGVRIDAEFDAISETLEDTLRNIALLQRDDGALANGSVGISQLSAAALALITSGAYSVRGAWVTGTAYVPGDVVSSSAIVYLCMTSHTSGVLATDVTAGKFLVMFDESDQALRDALALATGAGLIGSAGGITVQAALDAKTSIATLLTSAGATAVGWVQAGVGAVLRTLTAKVREQKVSIDDFGAPGDGTSDDTAALLAAATHVATTGGAVKFSRGKSYVIGDHTMVRGVTYQSQGRSFIDLFGSRPVAQITCKAGANGIFRNSASQIDSLCFKDLFLYSPSGRGHIFDWSLAGIVAKVQMSGITAIQLVATKRIINAPNTAAGTGVFSFWLSDFDFQYAEGATASPIYISGETINSIVIEKGWITLSNGNATSSAVKQIHIESTNPVGPAFNITCRDIVHEVPRGGCIDLLSCTSSLVENCMPYDLSVAPVNSMFRVAQGSTGGPSTNVRFEGCYSLVGTVGQPDLVLDCSVVGQGGFKIDGSTFYVVDGISAAGGAQTVINTSSITTKQNLAWLQIGGGPQNDIVFGSTSGNDWTLASGYTTWNPGFLKFLLNGAFRGAFSDAGLFQWAGTAADPDFYVDTLGEMRTKKPLYPPTYDTTFQSATAIVAGAGVPDNAKGINGQFYLRSDGVAGNAVYQKRAGAWVAVA